MYRRPGAHKAKAAPTRWLARYAGEGTGRDGGGAEGSRSEITGTRGRARVVVAAAAVEAATAAEATAAEARRRGHNEMRDTYSRILV